MNDMKAHVHKRQQNNVAIDAYIGKSVLTNVPTTVEHANRHPLAIGEKSCACNLSGFLIINGHRGKNPVPLHLQVSLFINGHEGKNPVPVNFQVSVL